MLSRAPRSKAAIGRLAISSKARAMSSRLVSSYLGVPLVLPWGTICTAPAQSSPTARIRLIVDIRCSPTCPARCARRSPSGRSPSSQRRMVRLSVAAWRSGSCCPSARAPGRVRYALVYSNAGPSAGVCRVTVATNSPCRYTSSDRDLLSSSTCSTTVNLPAGAGAMVLSDGAAPSKSMLRRFFATGQGRGTSFGLVVRSRPRRSIRLDRGLFPCPGA